MQKANLVLVMLFAQALQVLLLSVSVFAFFIVFGLLAIKDSVIQAWLRARRPIPHDLPSLVAARQQRALPGVGLPGRLRRPLLHRLRRHGRDVPRASSSPTSPNELETAVGAQRVYRALSSALTAGRPRSRQPAGHPRRYVVVLAPNVRSESAPRTSARTPRRRP